MMNRFIQYYVFDQKLKIACYRMKLFTGCPKILAKFQIKVVRTGMTKKYS